MKDFWELLVTTLKTGIIVFGVIACLVILAMVIFFGMVLAV